MLSQKKPAKYFELPENFFYDILLRADPFELRDEIFSCDKDQFPYLFETLLDTIEHDIEKILGDDPPQINESRELVDSTLLLSEAEFRVFSSYRDKLTHRQTNTIAALRSIRSIKREYFAREHLMNDPNVTMILLETVCLIVAAIRGDFFGDYARLIELGAALDHGSRAGRDDNLNKAIRREIKEGGIKLTADEIFSALEKRIDAEPDGDLYRVYPERGERSSIGWYDKKGKAQKTSRGSFNNRVSNVKKKLKKAD